MSEQQISDRELEEALLTGFDEGGGGEMLPGLLPGEEDEILPGEEVEPEGLETVSESDVQPKDEPPEPKAEPPKAEVPDALAARLAEIENLARGASREAKAASGRAQKVINEFSANQDDTAKPKQRAPSPELLQAAFTSSEAYKTLREEWPDHADTMDALGSVVGELLDTTTVELRREFMEREQMSSQELRIKARLDSAFPDWEDTSQSDDFRNWVYEGGPNLNERNTYDQLLRGRDPQADEYYSGLLEKYQDWADDRGNLYGTNSAEASIALLGMHAKAKEPAPEESGETEQQKLERETQEAERQERLRDNITPTKGAGQGLTPDRQAEAQEVFEKAFGDPLI